MTISRHRLVALIAAVVAAIVLVTAITGPAQANVKAPTPESLEEDGYTCEVVATKFLECTKKGSTTYWCSSGTCIPKPRQTGRPRKRPGDAGRVLVTADNGIKTRSVGGPALTAPTR